MNLFKRLWANKGPQTTASAASGSAPQGHSRPFRSGVTASGIVSRLGTVTLIVLVGAGGVLFVTWNADYWLLRDRLVHISEALFGDYVPAECRRDPSKCERDAKTGRTIPKRAPAPPSNRSGAECKGPEGLELHCQLHALFDYFNTELFEGQLPRPLITLQREKGKGGYYWHQKFRRAEGGRIDEIAINPSVLGGSSLLWIASILVHEMGHMDQYYFGNPGKGGFHNDEWGAIMRRVGLSPSATGQPGGRTTGTRMSHYIIPGGAFERAAKQHPLLTRERLAFYE